MNSGSFASSDQHAGKAFSAQNDRERIPGKTGPNVERFLKRRDSLDGQIELGLTNDVFRFRCGLFQMRLRILVHDQAVTITRSVMFSGRTMSGLSVTVFASVGSQETPMGFFVPPVVSKIWIDAIFVVFRL